ncbi:neuronal PAS domain-containing protein 3 [Lates japonicus]|uniref:Neuronal PAS domain-containing protein 3 n=1 Tax=Lates japonicus TaxID=270547 RepID=A0AAD3QVH7_LATJO|nr:neuronal PAS domain-containing protein 3 [Lates japonicus]
MEREREREQTGKDEGRKNREEIDPYWERPANAGSCSAARPKTLHLAGQQHTSSPCPSPPPPQRSLSANTEERFDTRK